MEKLNQKGMFLEKQLSNTHQYYRKHHLATVYKVPVLQMLNSNQNFKRAHYFCDYVGCYDGYYFEFEAKETYRQHFHCDQLRKSQHYKLKQVEINQGLSFVVVYFGIYKEFLLLFYDDLSNFVKQNSQKISYENCKKFGKKIEIKNNLILDYLPILSKKIASKRDIFSWKNYY